MNGHSSDSIKVLIVDDEENIRLSLSFMLKKEGYEVATASNGVEAIDVYRDFQPKIVLLDVMMPEMDGYATAEKLRLLDDHSEISILFLTAKGTVDDRRMGYMSGGDDYIVKPFDNENLLEKVAEKASEIL